MDTELRALKAMPPQPWEEPGTISKYQPTRLGDIPRSIQNLVTDPRQYSLSDLLGNVHEAGRNILTGMVGTHPGEADLTGIPGVSQALAWPKVIPEMWRKYFPEYLNIAKATEIAYPAWKQATALTPVTLADELWNKQGNIAEYLAADRLRPYGSMLLYGPKDPWATIHEGLHRLVDFDPEKWNKAIRAMAQANPKDVEYLKKVMKVGLPEEEYMAYSLSDMMSRQLGRKYNIFATPLFSVPKGWEQRLTQLLKTPMEWK